MKRFPTPRASQDIGSDSGSKANKKSSIKVTSDLYDGAQSPRGETTSPQHPMFTGRRTRVYVYRYREGRGVHARRNSSEQNLETLGEAGGNRVTLKLGMLSSGLSVFM